MINPSRYTGWRIAVANLSVSIESLERHRVEVGAFGHLIALSKLLFLRGDVLGRTRTMIGPNELPSMRSPCRLIRQGRTTRVRSSRNDSIG